MSFITYGREWVLNLSSLSKPGLERSEDRIIRGPKHGNYGWICMYSSVNRLNQRYLSATGFSRVGRCLHTAFKMGALTVA